MNLIRQRPDLRKAEWEVLAQSARIGVATADLYPRFSLTGIFTLDATDITQLFTGESFAYRAVPSMRWNILNFGRVRSHIAVQDARWEAALLRYRQAVLHAVEEVENALTAYVRNRQAEAELDEAVTALQGAVRVAHDQFGVGKGSIESRINAERDLAEVQDRLQEARGNVALSVVALYKALGGGWDWQSVPQTLDAVEPAEEAAPNVDPVPPPPVNIP